MNMLLTTIMQGKRRIGYMLLKYREGYERLPKGTISEKKIGGKKYDLISWK